MNVNVTSTINISDESVRQLLMNREGPLFQGVQRAGRRCATLAVFELASKGIGDTGRLQQSIEARTEVRGMEVVSRVGSALPYAKFVHEGTRSPIVPTTRRVLRFKGSGGAFVFAPQVRGTQETGNYVPFLTNALERIDINDFI